MTETLVTERDFVKSGKETSVQVEATRTRFDITSIKAEEPNKFGDGIFSVRAYSFLHDIKFTQNVVPSDFLGKANNPEALNRLVNDYVVVKISVSGEKAYQATYRIDPK